MFSWIWNNEDDTMIGDELIRHKTLEETKSIIDNYKGDGKNIKLTFASVNAAIMENNYDKLKYIVDYGAPVKKTLLVDIALDNGNDDMTRYLITEHGCKPSLYAKQIAVINGNLKLASFVDFSGTLRSNTGIISVHWGLNGWHDCIPQEYRSLTKDISVVKLNIYKIAQEYLIDDLSKVVVK
jgi:hypothetical protein